MKKHAKKDMHAITIYTFIAAGIIIMVWALWFAHIDPIKRVPGATSVSQLTHDLKQAFSLFATKTPAAQAQPVDTELQNLRSRVFGDMDQ